MKKLLPYLLFLFAVTGYAQNNSVFKTAISANADSTTVRNTVAASQSYYGNIGALYYNRQSSKWRIFSDSTWSDLITSGGGGGGIDTVFAYNGLTRVGDDSVRWGGTLTQNTSIVQAGFNTTFSGIGKVTFSPTTGGGSIAGFNYGSVAGNPTTLANGDAWYNSSTNTFSQRINGTTVNRNITNGVLGTGVNFYNTTGSGTFNNLAVGDGGNTSFGVQSLDAIIDGANFFNSSYNSAFGYLTGTAITTGRHASLLGYRAGASLTTGPNNTFIGSTSGQSVTTANDNTYVGYNTGSGATNTGAANTFLGSGAGAVNTSGAQSVMVGYLAGSTNTSGLYNVFIGSEAGETNTTQNDGVYIGHWAGLYVRGTQNTFIGSDVYAQTVVNPSSGDGNTALGYRAGLTDIITNASTSGNDNTYVGKQSGLGSTTQVSRSTALGYRAKVYSDESMVFGTEIAADRVNYGFGGESYGSGQGVIYVKEAVTNPSAAPTDGFQLFGRSTTGNAMLWNNGLTEAGEFITDNLSTWNFGTSTLAGSTRTIAALGSSSDIDLIFQNKGAGKKFQFNTTSGSAILDAGGSATTLTIWGGSASQVSIGGSSTDANLIIDGTSSTNVNVSGGQGVDVTLLVGTGGANTNDLIIETNTNAGQTLKINDGSNEQMGLAVLVGGTVTVNNVKVTANSRIFLTSQVDGGTPGFVRVSSRVAGTSFTITSSSGTDTSSIAWLIIEPN